MLESTQNEERARLLRVACDSHQTLYREAMCGAGVDRHLFALYVVKRYLEENSPLLDSIMPPVYELSTSQVRFCGNMSECREFRHHCNKPPVLI